MLAIKVINLFVEAKPISIVEVDKIRLIIIQAVK